ncbi:MAG TPA: adenylosuccinate synthase [Polyangiaceae bacterium]|jgi:adenylosuccinate synthase|nr:adenylosuccinate synthase [Polyangiaceae bacterium]
MSCVIVVGAQWGDEGKGKIVDIYTEHADLVVRAAGGANAGHTLVVGDERTILRLLPSGILRENTRCVLAQGMVIDPAVLVAEMSQLARQGVQRVDARVALSARAHLVLGYHQQIDALRETAAQARAIGTTKKGIGPALEDKVRRTGVLAGDLRDLSRLRDRIEGSLFHWRPVLAALGASVPRVDEIIAELEPLRARLVPLLTDTSRLVNDALSAGKKVLLEGAQGTLLDIDHGTYPFVTSSSPVASGAAVGAGLGPTRVTCVLGISKAYATRVGSGPFPTELPEPEGTRLREAGAEFGSVTGRPRRTGWFDLPGFKYAARVNGLDGFALTKLDVLTGLGTLRVCVAYDTPEGRTEELPLEAINDDPGSVKPVYEELPGWTEPLREARKLSELPRAAYEYVRFIEERSRVPLYLLSLGARRLETIVLKDPFTRPSPADPDVRWP